MPRQRKEPKKTSKKLQLPDDPEKALALVFTVDRERLDERLRERPEDDPVRRAYAAHDAMKEALAPENRKPVVFLEDELESLKAKNPELAAQWADSSEEEKAAAMEQLFQALRAELVDKVMVFPGKAPDRSKVNRDGIHQTWTSLHGASLELHTEPHTRLCDWPPAIPFGRDPARREWPDVVIDEATVYMKPPFTPTKIIEAVSALFRIDRELANEANRFNRSAVGGEGKKGRKGIPALTIDAYLATTHAGATFDSYFDALEAGKLEDRTGVSKISRNGEAVLFLNAHGHRIGQAKSLESLKTTFRKAANEARTVARKPKHTWREK